MYEEGAVKVEKRRIFLMIMINVLTMFMLSDSSVKKYAVWFEIAIAVQVFMYATMFLKRRYDKYKKRTNYELYECVYFFVMSICFWELTIVYIENIDFQRLLVYVIIFNVFIAGLGVYRGIVIVKKRKNMKKEEKTKSRIKVFSGVGVLGMILSRILLPHISQYQGEVLSSIAVGLVDAVFVFIFMCYLVMVYDKQSQNNLPS